MLGKDKWTVKELTTQLFSNESELDHQRELSPQRYTVTEQEALIVKDKKSKYTVFNRKSNCNYCHKERHWLKILP